jgi:hypothetical protein
LTAGLTSGAQQAARSAEPDATPACSNFKAAAVTAADAPKYDRTGVAAFMCRHGFVLSACIMTGPENFTYYEVRQSVVQSLDVTGS